MFVPYLVTILYLLVSELYAKQPDPIHDWAYTMMSQLYVVLPFSLLNILAFRVSAEGMTFTSVLPLSVFVFLWINDTGAYCCGSLLGRHKLFPRISPGKSWEGSVGGGVFVVAAAIGVWYLTEQYGINDLQLTMYEWIGLGLTVVVFGTWGDLVESLFKRTSKLHKIVKRRILSVFHARVRHFFVVVNDTQSTLAEQDFLIAQRSYIAYHIAFAIRISKTHIFYLNCHNRHFIYLLFIAQSAFSHD